MKSLNQKEAITGTLTAQFHNVLSGPMGTNEQVKLAGSLIIAQAAVDAACRVVQVMINNPGPPPVAAAPAVTDPSIRRRGVNLGRQADMGRLLAQEVPPAAAAAAPPPSPRDPLLDAAGLLKAFLYRVFTDHFHLAALASRADWSPWVADLQKIGRAFAAINAGLSASIVISDSHAVELLKKKQPSSGYVSLKKRSAATLNAVPADAAATTIGPEDRTMLDEWVDGRFKVRGTALDVKGNIHLDFRFLSRPDVSRLLIAATIIHEASHKFYDTSDNGYAGKTDGKYTGMSTAEAIDNADSYAFAAISIYKDIFILNEQAMPALAIAGVNLNA